MTILYRATGLLAVLVVGVPVLVYRLIRGGAR